MLANGTFTNNVGIWGIPGGDKTWCSMYVILFIISKGLKFNATLMMCNWDLKLGGIHANQTWPIAIDENITPHRWYELGRFNLLNKPKKMDFLRSVDVLFLYERGQCSTEFLVKFDIILRKVRNSDICFGGVLIFFSIDCTQIQPICGRPCYPMFQNGSSQTLCQSWKWCSFQTYSTNRTIQL